MATIKIEIVAAGQTYTRTKTISGPDLLRFINAYRAEAGLPQASTESQVASAWIDQVYEAVKSLPRRLEQNAAARSAEVAVPEITLT